jgi:hypothetical protein
MDDANGRVAAGQIAKAADSIAEESRRDASITEGLAMSEVGSLSRRCFCLRLRESPHINRVAAIP